MQQMKNSKITISNLAKDLELSTATISRALNDSSLISESVRSRIQARARELGYLARTVKKQRDRAILNVKLVLPHRNQPELQLFYDLSELIQGIREGADKVRVQLVTLLESEAHQIFDHKKGGHVDAVIFAFCKVGKPIYQELKEKNVPYLSINRTLQGGDFIVPDTDFGIRELLEVMTKSLPDKTQVRPLMIKLKTITKEVQSAREKAFLEVCAENKWSAKSESGLILEVDQLTSIDDTFVNKILNSEFNLIVGMNDLVATSLIQCLLHATSKMKRAYVIGGYDYAPFVHLLRHPLYTVSMNVKKMGERTGFWLTQKVMERKQEVFQEKIRGKVVVIE